ncbi:MAG: thiolase family protein [Parachlamydia sp.]|nr:thiolase family protein [Parachlamydia sp.]
MKERIAIVDGIRTPFCKAGGAFRDYEADDLGAFAVKELMARTGFPQDKIDELIFGNVMQPPHLANIARIIAVKGGMPIRMPAFTVNRNCASGMESLASAYNKILLGEADVIIAGGSEAMSNFPVLFGKKMREFLVRLNKAKGWKQKIAAFLSFRPSFLVPEIPEIADPLCGLNMGQTAEKLSREFHVTRQEQDQFALMSQQRALKATTSGLLAQEIVPIPLPVASSDMQAVDDGPRSDQTLEILGKLKPVFDKVTGSVTAGNSSQVTDGAVALLLMKESKAKQLGLKPLGYITEYSYAALDPSRMGLGPVYAIHKLLAKTGQKLSDFQLIEINEAFAAQVLAVVKAAASPEFCRRELGLEQPLGEIPLDILNVNGGAVALGHPVGASGGRLVLTLLKELRRRNQQRGLATLCVGGGQGEAMVVEVE